MVMGRRLVMTIRLSKSRGYEIANAAGIRPETLSKLMHGALPIRPGDPRVLAVARVLGIPARDAFEPAEPAAVDRQGQAPRGRRRMPVGPARAVRPGTQAGAEAS
jgi:hypothetical protein